MGKQQHKLARIPAEWRPIPGQFQVDFTEASSRSERDAVLTTLRKYATQTAEFEGQFYHFTVVDNMANSLGSAEQVATVIERVIASPAIEDIFPSNRGAEPYGDPFDPEFQPQPAHNVGGYTFYGQYNLHRLYVAQAQDMMLGDIPGIRIGIIGGPVTPHQDFGARLSYRNTCKGNNTHYGNYYEAHPSASLGAAAMTANNGIGGTGIAGGVPELISFVESRPVGDTVPCVGADNLIQGLRDAGSVYGIRVLIVDFLTIPSAGLRAAVQEAVNEGVLIVAAAGNDGQVLQENTTYLMCPACYAQSINGVVAVGSTVASTNIGPRGRFQELEQRRADSNRGPNVTIQAPGEHILGVSPNGTQACNTCYTLTGATSGAAPQVAGIAALVRAANPLLTPAQVRDLLQQTADTGDPNSGGGFANTLAAVSIASPGLAQAARVRVERWVLNSQTGDCPYGANVGEWCVLSRNIGSAEGGGTYFRMFVRFHSGVYDRLSPEVLVIPNQATNFGSFQFDRSGVNAVFGDRFIPRPAEFCQAPIAGSYPYYRADWCWQGMEMQAPPNAAVWYRLVVTHPNGSVEYSPYAFASGN